jgi:hypothetical protein
MIRPNAINTRANEKHHELLSGGWEAKLSLSLAFLPEAAVNALISLLEVISKPHF